MNLATCGYGKPPWIFKGRALYQLHLVKAETARAIIPKEFRLLEAFGYTLGGFFLAHYDDSPAGVFDELVVIAGTGKVRNNPTPCAWAASVFVNSNEACIHGREEFGLPSQVARFIKGQGTSRTRKNKTRGLSSTIGSGTDSHTTKNGMDRQVIIIDEPDSAGFCSIGLSSAVPMMNSVKWMSPRITISLPSFSGLTKHNPHLLKYSCQIQCRIRPISPAKVWRPSTLETDGEGSSEGKSRKAVSSMMKEEEESKRDLSILVMLSKPILAVEFNSLHMLVNPPDIVHQASQNSTQNLE